MKKLLPIALMALLACKDGAVNPPPAPIEAPGSIAQQLSLALSCPVPQITFGVVEPNGGTMSGNVYTPPICGLGPSNGLAHIQGDGCGKTATVEVILDDQHVVDLTVCGVATGTSCCANPLRFPYQPPDSPPQTAQMYATLIFACHNEYSPSEPPMMCP